MIIRRIARRREGQRGTTLVELVSVTAILLVLAGLAIPVANTMVKRQKELELRRALRDIRTAINRFHDDVARFEGIRRLHLDADNEEGYPEELQWLVEGIDIGDAAGTKLKYLRRIPRDPITGSSEWGTRSSRDGPDVLMSDGINIFDVFTTSDKTALDGTPYAEW